MCKRNNALNGFHLNYSNHFDEGAYERDLRNELLGLPLRRRLKIKSLPTLCLSNLVNETEGSKEPENSLEKKHESVERMLSAELQERREADALKRAEDAERRKEEVNRIIMMEVSKKTNVPGVTIESQKSQAGHFVHHRAVLRSKVRKLRTRLDCIKRKRRKIIPYTYNIIVLFHFMT